MKSAVRAALGSVTTPPASARPLVTLVVATVGVSLPPLVDPDGEWAVPFAAIVVAL